MRKISPERRRVAVIAGASSAISGSSLLLFKDVPHTAFYDSLHGLLVGVPLGVTLMLFYRLKRNKSCTKVPPQSL